MRARILRRRNAGVYDFTDELDVADADEAWRQLQHREPLREGDVVFVGDLYFELDGDGGWRRLEPGNLTRSLYLKATVDAQNRPDL